MEGREGMVPNKEVTAAMNQWLDTKAGAVQGRVMRLAVKHPNLKILCLAFGAGSAYSLATGNFLGGAVGGASMGAAYLLDRAERSYNNKKEDVRSSLKTQAQPYSSP